jgi:hypothetical protein
LLKGRAAQEGRDDTCQTSAGSAAQEAAPAKAGLYLSLPKVVVEHA